MSEKVIKKIGEAYAFSDGLGILQAQYSETLTNLLGSQAPTIPTEIGAHKAALESIAAEFDMTEILLPKAERTQAKITKMGDMYVGDQWDDPAEVLEWLSFYLGAAIIHWELIAGAARQMQHEVFVATAETGVAFYENLFATAKERAAKIGQDRATA